MIRNSFVRYLLFRLLNLNSSATVVADWAQSLHATSSNDLDVVAVDTHLNELVSNGVSTLLRELLVVLSRTSLAVSVTSNNDLRVVLLSNLSQLRNVLEVLLRSNLSLVDVEEY